MARERSKSIRRVACLITTGVSVGWIMGLSASPVAQTVLVTLLGLANTLVVALPTPAKADNTETKTDSAEESSAQPPHGTYHSRVSRDESLLLLALLSLFIALGAAVGIYTRSHDLLALSPSGVIARWKSTGLADDAIARRLFDQVYPAEPVKHGESNSEHKSEPAANPHLGALYSAAGQAECEEYKTAPDADLRRLMLTSENPSTKAFAESTTDTKALRAAVKEFLCAH